MNKNVTQNSKKQVLLIVAILLAGLMVSGGTFAFWLWRGTITNTNVVVELPNLGLTLDGGTTTITGLAPASCKNTRYAKYSTITIQRHNETQYPAYVVLKLSLDSFTWTRGTSAPNATSLSSIRFAVSSNNYNNINDTCSNSGTLSGNTSSTVVTKPLITYANVPESYQVGSLNVSGVSVGTKNSPVQNQNKRLLTWIYEIPANTGTESSPITETYYIYYWLDKNYTGIAASPSANGSGENGIVDPLQDMTYKVVWSAAEIVQVQDLTTVSSYTGV